MELETFVQTLELPEKGEFRNGAYIIDLDNSDEYAHCYDVLFRSGLVDLDEEATEIFTDAPSKVVYRSEDYDVILYADFNSDVYKIKIKEVK